MTINKKYSNKAKDIKGVLSQYSKESVLAVALQYLERVGGDPLSRAKSMPGIVFLLIKWSMTSAGSNAHEITHKQFSELANRIYSLQSLALALNNSNPFELKIRTLLMSQVASQKSDESELLALARQRVWFLSDGDQYYRSKFISLCGFSLDKFFSLASIFACHAADCESNELSKINISRLIVEITPTISPDEIALFLKLTSTSIASMPEFFNTFSHDDCPTWEYFSETPLIERPLIVHGDEIFLVNRKLYLRAMSCFVSNLMKKDNGEEFKRYFGPTLERYVENIFDRGRLTYLTEIQIKKSYQCNQNKIGKVVDFIIEDDGCRIFVDAKAIEPTNYVSTCTDPVLLRDRLQGSYIKAIWQGQECCKNMMGLSGFRPMQSFLLIVVHQDHFISTGGKIGKDVHPELSMEIEGEFGMIPIPLDNIYYLTIHDLERLISLASNNITTISKFLTEVIKSDADPVSAKLLFDMHLTGQPGGTEDKFLVEELVSFFETAGKLVRLNLEYWNGKVYEFVGQRQKLAALLQTE